MRIGGEHAAQLGAERHGRAGRRGPQHLRRDEAKLANGARQGLIAASPLDEQPGHHVESDDAECNDRRKLGGVLVFVGKHGRKDSLSPAFLASFEGTQFACATSGCV